MKLSSTVIKNVMRAYPQERGTLRSLVPGFWQVALDCRHKVDEAISPCVRDKNVAYPTQRRASRVSGTLAMQNDVTKTFVLSF